MIFLTKKKLRSTALHWSLCVLNLDGDARMHLYCGIPYSIPLVPLGQSSCIFFVHIHSSPTQSPFLESIFEMCRLAVRKAWEISIAPSYQLIILWLRGHRIYASQFDVPIVKPKQEKITTIRGEQLGGAYGFLELS